MAIFNEKVWFHFNTNDDVDVFMMGSIFHVIDRQLFYHWLLNRVSYETKDDHFEGADWLLSRCQSKMNEDFESNFWGAMGIEGFLIRQSMHNPAVFLDKQTNSPVDVVDDDINIARKRKFRL